jgi:hypothetical protein
MRTIKDFADLAPWVGLVAMLTLAACGGGSTPSSAVMVSDSVADSAAATVGTRDASDADAHPLPPVTADEPPAFGGATAPEPIAEREQALAATCPAPTYARPKVAAWDLSRDASATRQALLAKFGFAIVSVAPSALGPFAANIKQINPDTRLAQYLKFADLKPSASTGDENHALVQEVNARNWWLRTSSGGLASWTGGLTAGINVTTWVAINPSGRRWPQFKARFDHDTYFKGAPGVDYAFTSNTLSRPRVSADWRRNGTNQPPSDAAVQSAMRSGYAAYWSALRAANPALKIIAGADNDLSAAEYKGVADAVYLDGMIGASWSIETWGGWSAMLQRYRGAMANVKPGKVAIFHAFGESPSDYAALRYGMASALLDDGYFMFRPRSGSQVPAMYDEYLAPLGQPATAPPTAAASNGIWMRRYEHGLVLVNPQQATASIDIGSGYRRIAGTQDPGVNNGQAQQTVTLGPRQGLIMVKVDPPCAPAPSPAPAPAPPPGSGWATPKVAALDYSRDTSAARQAWLARFDYVLLGLTKSMGPAQIGALVNGVKRLNPSIRLGQYVLNNEILCDSPSNHDAYVLVQEVNRNNWWLRTAAGTRVQWATKYNACDINMTQWAPRNAAGQTWVQFKWQYDQNAFFKHAPFDFVFIDNTFGVPRTTADWKRIGVDISKSDPEVGRAMRQGHVAYWNAVRGTNSKLQILVNADNDLSFAEYQEGADGAFLEGSIGKSWSRETWAGWNAMMEYYRGAIRNVRSPQMVFLNTFANPTDYALIRYGLASAMMEDGYFLYIALNAEDKGKQYWYDEFSVPIGSAAEPPPTAAKQNGLWMRRYTNGLVLVNPSKTASASIDVGRGYKRMSGSQQPSVNHGRAEQVVTLGPRQGLLMLKQ